VCVGAVAQSVPSSSASTSKDSDDAIVLATNVFSSFSSDTLSNEDAQGLLPHLDCVFKKMGRNYRVQITPWRRAYLDVKSARVDGFFTAISMKDANKYATLSAPLIMENWYWFWRDDTDAPASWRKGYKLGSILGSQQETWLADAGYKVDMSANNLPQLIKLLESKRIDVLLADHDHFMRALKSLDMESSNFQSRFFRYVPLGVYFNKQLLKTQEGFLRNFNSNITECATTHFQVSAFEQQRITDLLVKKITQWGKLPGLDVLLKRKNSQSSLLMSADITIKDSEWIRAFAKQDDKFASTLVDETISSELRKIKEQEKGVITEIIITDARGLNAAISDMTSDYWQGDEEKFTRVFATPPNTLYFSGISYDESTRHFQLQISTPLYGQSTKEAMGVMVIGVDVEKILSLEQ